MGVTVQQPGLYAPMPRLIVEKDQLPLVEWDLRLRMRPQEFDDFQAARSERGEPGGLHALSGILLNHLGDWHDSLAAKRCTAKKAAAQCSLWDGHEGAHEVKW